MSDEEMLELAAQVMPALRADNTLTVDELSARFDVEQGEMVRLLDEYRVDQNDQITHVGPGGGGGWLS